MKKISEIIVFFGSGPVAAKSLQALNDNFNIEAVITKPAKSRRNDPVPVIDVANKLGIRTFLPADKTELDDLFSGRPVKSELAVIIDYGIIVSQRVIDYFPLGIVNSHFSLLPKWRGADPITFSILSGETVTGVSLMLINAKLDEGLLLAQGKTKISNDMTSHQLTEELIKLSHDLLVKWLPRYVKGELEPSPQDSGTTPTYSRKLNKIDGLIDWQKPAEQIEREIRAYHTWPKSYTNIGNISVTVTKAHVVDERGSPGKFKADNGKLIFYTSLGGVEIDKLKPAGKNEMDSRSFLAGYGKVLI